MKTVTVNIVTPDGPVYDSEVSMVIAKTVSGEIGVLAGFPATVIMLVVIYIALKQSVHLALAISLGIVAWGVFLIIQKFIVATLVS